MIGLAGGRTVFLAIGVTDLRRGVSGLYALILEQLEGEPLSGAVYGFCSRRRRPRMSQVPTAVLKGAKPEVVNVSDPGR